MKCHIFFRGQPTQRSGRFSSHWKIGIQTRTDTSRFYPPSPYLCAAHNQFQSSPPLLSLSLSLSLSSLPPRRRFPSPAATPCCSASALAQTMFDLPSRWPLLHSPQPHRPQAGTVRGGRGSAWCSMRLAACGGELRGSVRWRSWSTDGPR
jgi:hypothetical protein